MVAAPYRRKLQEAEFHLKQTADAFVTGDSSFVHSFNAFLSAAQSVIWVLNKSFSKRDGYLTWTESRPDRLPAEARVFKELRNVSIKRGPVENTSVIIGWHLGAGSDEPALGPNEAFTSPMIDRLTGEVHGVATVTSADGRTTREVDAQAIYDFGIVAQSGSKVLALDAVVTTARQYLSALRREIDECERSFS